MNRQIGIGVIGLGWMGRLHASSFKRVPDQFPDLGMSPRLVVASDLSADQRRHAEAMGFERTTDDWRSVVEDPAVEVVSVTTPNALHREIATAVVEAGKHLWVEKPVGRSLDDMLAIAEAAEKAGVVHAVGFCYRFVPSIEHCRQLIAADEIGEVTHYRGSFLTDWASRPDVSASWRFFREAAGSGVLGDLMAHVVDLTHFLVGPIQQVTGRTAIVIPSRPRPPVGGAATFDRVVGDDRVAVENEDWAAAMFELETGQVGSLEVSRVAVGPHALFRIEILGTRGRSAGISSA